MEYIHIMEYDSLLRKKKIVIYATTWMDPEDILSEMSQSQNDKYCIIPLI